MTKHLIVIIPLTVLVASCAVKPVGSFDEQLVPQAPDYGSEKNWAALPFKVDSADVLPDTSMKDLQSIAKADVFYVYPTTYTGKRGHKQWNADVSDSILNVRTDKSAIRNQATVFNGVCRVYAPRYRQAHLEVFYTRRHKEDAVKALNLAYQDVRNAFEYYLAHYNQGRPLVIAAHSQGTIHSARLIREFYSGDRIMPDLIVAYLIGMPVQKELFETIPPCEDSDDINCFCSWRTVDEKYEPNRLYPTGEEYCVTNPLTWTCNGGVADRSLHKGAVLRKYHDGYYPELLDAWVDDGLLRVSKPKIPGVPFLPIRNYHVADYNFFYVNMRLNVGERVNEYLGQRK
jgi:hypothetical protein